MMGTLVIRATMLSVVLLSGCGDGSSRGPDIFTEVADASMKASLAGLNHSSSTANAVASSTSCREPAPAQDEERLRAKYTRSETGICKRDDDGEECLYALVLDDAAVLLSEAADASTSHERIAIAFKGHLHQWSFLQEAGGQRFFIFASSQDSSTCDPSGAYQYTYSAGDIGGEFEALAIPLGTHPPSQEELSQDVLSCVDEACVGSEDGISLSLPADSFDAQQFQGYRYEGAAASINGTGYGRVIGTLSPAKDRGTFVACPDSASLSDSVGACVIIVLERLPTSKTASEQETLESSSYVATKAASGLRSRDLSSQVLSALKVR